MYGGKGQDELFGGAQDDLLEGGADADKLYGEGGNDTLYGGDGADELWGDKSVEVYNEDMRLREGGSLAEGTAYRYIYRLHQDGPEVAGDDRLEGGPGNDFLRGGGGADVYVVNRGDGADTIDDPEGANRIRFGAGIDVDDLTLGQASGAGGERYFTIKYTASDKLSINHGLLGAFKSYEFADGTALTHAELLARRAPTLKVEGSSQADVIEGGAQGDALYGKSGDDTLRGGAGADALSGGFGSDVLEGGEGNDQLLGYEPYSTQGAQEHDTLYGGRGNDRMFGGLGDDVYRIDRGDGIDTLGDGADDPVGGFDTLRFGAGVLPEQVTLYRTQSYLGSGDDLVVVLDAGAQQITISGFFNGSYDRRIEQFVFDNGNGPVWALEDINARVIAGAPNTMTGTSGDDTFSVDHGSDTVTEAADAGTDSIESWVSYTLPANVENLTLAGLLHIEGTGNALDNILRGNAGNNSLRGGGGNDTFYGGAGDDVYDLKDQGGTVIEFAGEGNDTVVVADTYTLPDNVENLVQYSRSIFTVYSTGNALDNVIQGRDNASRDVLDGRAGADTMKAGRSGSATFVVDNPGDRVIADPLGFDNDKVLSAISYTLGPSVENLTLTGAEPISGTGNELKNTL
ncbi:MAG: calcium-binding protein, partial [bacterium]